MFLRSGLVSLAACLALTADLTAGGPPAKKAPADGRTAAEREEAALERLLAQLGPVPFAHGGRVFSIAFAPDGQRVTSVGQGVSAHSWHPQTGKELAGFFRHGSRSVALTPDGRLLAAVDYSGAKKAKYTIRVWDLGGNKQLQEFEGSRRVNGLFISPRGKLLALTSLDSTITLWDADAGKPRHVLPATTRPHAQQALAFSPDEKRMAAAMYDGSVRVWDTVTGRELSRLAGTGAETRFLTFSPDGKTLAVGGGDARVRLWDTRTDSSVREFLVPAEQGVVSGTFSPDGRVLAVGGHGVSLWEIASGKERGRLEQHRDAVTCVAFSADGKRLATGGADRTAAVRWVRAPALAAAPGPGHWADLASPDAAKAYRAVSELIAVPARAVPLLKEQLLAMRPATSAPIADLIANLDNKRFTVRERAMAELQRLEENARAAILRAVEVVRSEETRRRLEQLLARLKRFTSLPQRLQVLRAVEVLESIGTAEARAVLRTLADGPADDDRTLEARAALRRLKQR